jgi:hypothetical protein
MKKKLLCLACGWALTSAGCAPVEEMAAFGDAGEAPTGVASRDDAEPATLSSAERGVSAELIPIDPEQAAFIVRGRSRRRTFPIRPPVGVPFELNLGSTEARAVQLSVDATFGLEGALLVVDGQMIPPEEDAIDGATILEETRRRLSLYLLLEPGDHVVEVSDPDTGDTAIFIQFATKY